MRKRPHSPDAAMPAVFTAWSNLLNEVSARVCQPNTARVTLEQQNPKVSSSAFTRALTLDWLRPSALAACRKFRCSATAMNCTREMSGILPDRIPPFVGRDGECAAWVPAVLSVAGQSTGDLSAGTSRDRSSASPADTSTAIVIA